MRARLPERSAVSLFLALLLATHPAVAQQPMDLAGALRQAESSNLELLAIRQQRSIALAGLSTARQIPNPTISFSAARDTPHESVVWDQPVELGGKRSKRIAVAQEEQRAIDLDIAALSRQVRRRTREAFFRSLTAHAQTDQSKISLDMAMRIKNI